MLQGNDITAGSGTVYKRNSGCFPGLKTTFFIFLKKIEGFHDFADYRNNKKVYTFIVEV